MTTILAADTTVRSASAALERRLAQDWSEQTVDTAALDRMALEQAALNLEIGRLVAQMEHADLASGTLDRLTAEIAALLARAEGLRASRAWAAAGRAGDQRRWQRYLDLD